MGESNQNENEVYIEKDVEKGKSENVWKQNSKVEEMGNK